MKVLFVASDLSRRTPTSLRTLKLAGALSVDMSVSLLSLESPYEATNARVYALNSSVRPNSPLVRAWRVLRRLAYRLRFFQVFIPDWGGLVGRFYEAIVGIEKEVAHDFIILTAPPHGLLALLRHRVIAKKCVVDLCDPIVVKPPDTALGIGELLNVYFERKMISSARGLITTNKITLDHYGKGFCSDSAVVIPQGISSDFVGIQARAACPSPSPFRLIYAGAFYQTLRDPYPLLRAIAYLNRDRPLVSLEIFGGFVFDPHAQQALRDLIPRGIVVNPSISQSGLAAKYVQAHMAVFLDNAYGIQTPGKVVEYLGMGIPVLYVGSNPRSPALEAASPVPENWFTTPNLTDAIAQTLHNLATAPPPPWLCPDAYYEKNSWEARGRRLRQFLESLRSSSELGPREAPA